MINTKYHKEIYDKKALLKAIDAYEGIVQITLSEDASYYHCLFSHFESDASLTVSHFSNYLIDLMNNRGNS